MTSKIKSVITQSKTKNHYIQSAKKHIKQSRYLTIKPFTAKPHNKRFPVKSSVVKTTELLVVLYKNPAIKLYF